MCREYAVTIRFTRSQTELDHSLLGDLATTLIRDELPNVTRFGAQIRRLASDLGLLTTGQ